MRRNSGAGADAGCGTGIGPRRSRACPVASSCSGCTSNKATELSDYSVCTTWGVRGKDLFLLGLFRRRLEYPALKRAVREQQSLYNATEVLIEDKASGTQLIQELIADGCPAVTR
jgi:phage terminase large subunit-like protein